MRAAALAIFVAACSTDAANEPPSRTWQAPPVTAVCALARLHDRHHGDPHPLCESERCRRACGITDGGPGEPERP